MKLQLAIVCGIIAALSGTARAGWTVDQRLGHAECGNLSPLVTWSGVAAFNPGMTWVVTASGQPDPFQLQWSHHPTPVSNESFAWTAEVIGYSHESGGNRSLSAVEDLYFVVDTVTPFEVRASRGTGGSILARLERLMGIGGGTESVLLSRELSSQSQYIEQGILTPGAYRFVSALSLSVPGGVGDVVASGGASIVIPAPSSLGMLLVSGLWGTRRRRVAESPAFG